MNKAQARVACGAERVACASISLAHTRGGGGRPCPASEARLLTAEVRPHCAHNQQYTLNRTIRTSGTFSHSHY